MNRLMVRAQQALRTAQHLLEYGDTVAAGSRAYYAVFDAMRAVLDDRGIDVGRVKTHRGLMIAFEQNVVKPGVLKREVATAILKASELRRVSDYDAEAEISVDDVRGTLSAVESFVKACGGLLERKDPEDSGDSSGGAQ